MKEDEDGVVIVLVFRPGAISRCGLLSRAALHCPNTPFGRIDVVSSSGSVCVFGANIHARRVGAEDKLSRC